MAALCGRYGCRKVTIAGSIITMFGFAVSTQSSSIEMLIVTYGVIGGTLICVFNKLCSSLLNTFEAQKCPTFFFHFVCLLFT